MFEKMEIEFTYIKEGQEKKVSFQKNIIQNDFSAYIEWDKNKSSENLKLTIMPVDKITIEELIIKIPYSYDVEQKIFINGYQSWTDSREMSIDDKLKKFSKVTAPVINKYQLEKYGDYLFKDYSGKRGELHGYTYSYIRRNETFEFIGSLTERAGFTIIEHDTNRNYITIRKECKGITITDSYIPFQIFYALDTENNVFDEYFAAMGIEKPRCKPRIGWTSWYNYYQNINQYIIEENIDNFKNFHRKIDIFQIDDGYQTAVGDWLSVDKVKFPKGMRYIADKIKKNGEMAGIWLAPFVCETNSIIFKEKQDWILKDKDGKPVSAGCNWSGFYALDFYHPEVRDYLKNVFEVVLEQWGYDLVKLDFLYAVCLLPRADKTRGQIMTEAMEFLRECVGDKLILGCGVPLGPSFGLVDYCRIGCDVSLDWDDKFYMRFLHRERVSTRNAIGNAIGRRQLNNRAFLNDPDVFLLREDNIQLDKNQKETLAVVNNLFGSLLFTSDNLNNYKDDQFELFDKAVLMKDRSILKVNWNRDDLVEILYEEDGKQYLLLINMSRKALMYTDKSSNQKSSIAPYGNKIINKNTLL